MLLSFDSTEILLEYELVALIDLLDMNDDVLCFVGLSSSFYVLPALRSSFHSDTLHRCDICLCPAFSEKWRQFQQCPGNVPNPIFVFHNFNLVLKVFPNKLSNQSHEAWRNKSTLSKSVHARPWLWAAYKVVSENVVQTTVSIHFRKYALDDVTQIVFKSANSSPESNNEPVRFGSFFHLLHR